MAALSAPVLVMEDARVQEMGALSVLRAASFIEDKVNDDFVSLGCNHNANSVIRCLSVCDYCRNTYA